MVEPHRHRGLPGAGPWSGLLHIDFSLPFEEGYHDARVGQIAVLNIWQNELSIAGFVFEDSLDLATELDGSLDGEHDEIDVIQHLASLPGGRSDRRRGGHLRFRFPPLPPATMHLDGPGFPVTWDDASLSGHPSNVNKKPRTTSAGLASYLGKKYAYL